MLGSGAGWPAASPGVLTQHDVEERSRHAAEEGRKAAMKDYVKTIFKK